jgi:uncharacterized membrane protein
MRIPIIALLLLLLSATAAAADNTSIASIFTGNGTGIEPPSPGVLGEAQLADGLAESAGAPMALKAVAAQEAGPKDVSLSITDADTGEPIRDAHIRVFMDNGRDKTGTLRYVGNDSRMDLQLDDGQWSISLMLDITSTVGKDYYASLQLAVSADQSMTVFMQPVGSLTGEVLDASNNLLPGATVKFECAGDYGLIDPVTTDSFGSFKAEWLPIGSCKVSALSGNKVGSMTVQIAQGQLSEVRISLEQGIATVKDDYTVPIIIILAVFAAAVVLLLRRKPAAGEKPEPVKPDRHMGAILSALDENEKKIIESLMSSGGKSLQSRLGRELGLPKSSLSRAVSGLEARDILKTERLGRVRNVELSQWFLNGKKPY